MSSQKTLHTIAAATWTRYDKWRVELEIVGEPKRVCWLTATQYDYLQSAFEHTKNGYSDSRCTVIGEFTDDGHYLRCQALAAMTPASTPKHHTPLIETGNEVAHEFRDNY